MATRKARPARRGRTKAKSKSSKPRKSAPRGARAQARPARKPARSAPAKKAAKPAAKRTPAKPGAAPRAARGPERYGAGIVRQHLDYTSHDVAGVRRFYGELLGLPVDFDPEANYLSISTSASSSLGFMPPMPGPPEQWRPPREPSLYFMVDDVDRVHRDLIEKGVEFDQPPTDMFWGHRVARLRDPEGRLVMLAQVLQGTGM